MLNSFNYYKSLWQLFQQYRKKSVELKNPPLRFWIELSAECNLRCLMCPNKDLPARQKGFMEIELFKKIIAEIKDFAQEINLHHRGESLLHPQFNQVLKQLAEEGMQAKLHTNGTLLDEEKIRAIVDYQSLKRVSFSFDGFKKDDYEKIRVGANFEQTVDRILELLKYRKRKNKKYPLVALEVIALSARQLENIKHSEVLKKFKEAGLDELKIKKSHNWAGYLNSGLEKKSFSACTFLWNAMVILYDGRVSACAQDFFGKLIMGDLNEKTVQKIWNDLPLVNLRKVMTSRNISSQLICSNCDRIWREKILGIPAEYLKDFLFKKMP